jgi:hypothetical protein
MQTPSNAMKSLTLAAALLLGTSSGHASSLCDAVVGNVVANCGFESGAFDGWTLSGVDVPLAQDNLYGVEGTDPYPTPAGTAPDSGSFQAFFSDITADTTTLSQVLTTTPGSYTVSFALAQQLEGPGTVKNSVVVTLDGATLATLSAVPVQGYTFYTYTGTVAGGTSTLSLAFGNDIGEFILDDVTVVAVAPVPEASTSALLGAGLLALGGGALRRRKTRG